ncbi:MAG: hypothetical protein WC382_08040 [Methanoregulaceae archaeon]|jgi:hypothetical protein
MEDYYDNSELDPLDDFTDHWDDLIDNIETLELTPKDTKLWYLKFKSDRSIFFLTNPVGSDYEYNEQHTRMRQIENYLDIAINKGKTNYRNNERIRLKEAYGVLSEIIFWFRLIFRTI